MAGRKWRMDSVTRKAYAKINLGLDVLRRRPDGYHEVRMIMQTVDIWDLLTFTRLREPGIRLQVDVQELSAAEDNLVYRAAQLILQEYGIKEGVEITLEKHIPIAAGMAGGSSDAAAVFHGLNSLFDLSMTQRQMQKLGVRLGADIPYCIMGGTALSEGIGEMLTALPAPPACHVVVAKPDISVSTKFVYENLRVDSLEHHPDIDGMQQAIKAGNLKGITRRMENVLETVTEGQYPVISRIKERMLRSGAENALMSGSGPTVFGIFEEREDALKAASDIKEAALAGEIFVTGFFNGTDR